MTFFLVLAALICAVTTYASVMVLCDEWAIQHRDWRTVGVTFAALQAIAAITSFAAALQ